MHEAAHGCNFVFFWGPMWDPNEKFWDPNGNFGTPMLEAPFQKRKAEKMRRNPVMKEAPC